MLPIGERKQRQNGALNKALDQSFCRLNLGFRFESKAHGHSDLARGGLFRINRTPARYDLQCEFEGRAPPFKPGVQGISR